MKTKKSAKADLESKRALFLQIGLILTLSIVYMSFQWKSDYVSISGFSERAIPVFSDDLTPITKIEKPLQPAPVPPPPILFNPVDVPIGEDDFSVNAEATPLTVVEPWAPQPSIPEDIVEEDAPIDFCEVEPSFPGGDAARIQFLRDNIRYPKSAREINIQGTVYVNFVVEKDGSVSRVKIIRSIGGGCEEEAIRVTQMMPKWNPGLQRNRPVRVSYNMPIKFTLIE